MSVDALAFKKTLFLEQLYHQLILDAEAHGCFLLSFLTDIKLQKTIQQCNTVR